MTYADLAEACLALRRGVTWVAANRDATLPTTRGELPGCGALVAALEAATGRRPEVAGKPELTLHEESVRRSRARRPLVVGDRLDTDIAGAQAAGTPSLLVLTGVTDLAALERAGPGERPTYLAADLRGLLTAHPPDDELSAARSRLAAAWGAAESPA
jgi:ribonucleotide monophosphatase NagD (HAD superfamily)